MLRKRLIIIIRSLILIIIFSIISSLTSNRIALPIKRLSAIVGEIKHGNLESRAELDATGEILDLQKGINSMSETLQHSRETMKSEIQKATESLQNANRELAKKNIKLVIAEKTAVDASHSKSQFLANMSHEIRTPLNGIIGFTDFLKKTELSIDQREQLDIIDSCSKSLLNIINDILDFSKAESGNLQVNNEPLNLNNLIDEIINITTPDAHQKDLIIGYVIYDDVNPNIISDEQKIHHILVNLISNAIKSHILQWSITLNPSQTL